MQFAFFVVFAVLLHIVPFSIVGGSPLTPSTLHSLKRLGTVSVNSNAQLVYSVREWDPTTNKVTNNLHTFDRGLSRKLTDRTAVSDTSPTFSTDGKIVAFLSSRSGSQQVHIVPFLGSEAQITQLTTFPVDIDNFWWKTSADGDFLVYTIQVYPDCPTLECTASRDEEVAARGPNTWKVYDSLFVRHWDKWETGKLSHIFTQKISLNSDGTWTLQGDPQDLLKGLYINSPVPPFGGPEQIDVSPDGKEIAFTGEIVNSESAWSTSWRLYLVPTDGSVSPISIVDSIPARTQNPRYSPSGEWLAYLAMDRPGFEADKLHINLYNRQTRTTTTLTSTVDLSFSGILWDKDSSYIIADADYYNSHALFVLKASDREPSYPIVPILKEGSVSSIISTPTSNVFYIVRNSMQFPDDIWRCNFSAGQIFALFQLTFINQDILSGLELQTAEQFNFIGSLDETVYGWLLKPHGFNPSKKVPLVNLIHGGPQSAWLDSWSYRWNPQIWSGHGYAVVMINFHGSTGFGQAFTDAITGHWGDYPYWDIMNGTMAVLEDNLWIDSEKVGAAGASYGGYMINWIQGQTNFFKVLVTHDGIYDTDFCYYSTEELWFPEWEFKSVPWVDNSLYAKWNPSRFINNWKTPHLIIHGQNDFRLPVSHGLAAFTALQRKGIPSQFLYFTEENHWVLNSANSIKWNTVVLDWLDVYLQK